MKDEQKIRVLVADDHFIVRIGLLSVINTEPDMHVVGEAADGSQAVELFVKSNPDVVLMDLRMPVKDGIEATEEIRFRRPGARIRMLATFDGEAARTRAITPGSTG